MTLTEKQKANLPPGLQKAILARMRRKNSPKVDELAAKGTCKEMMNPSVAIMLVSPEMKPPEEKSAEKNYSTKKIVCPACGAKFNS